MKNFSWNKANDLTEIENKSKLKTISTLFDKKAEENNTIDLNAYEKGFAGYVRLFNRKTTNYRRR